jgi:hypothetical protein
MRDNVISAELLALKRANVVKYATASSREIPIIIENIVTKEKTEYKSIREAARVLGFNDTSLVYALKKNSVFKKNYIV